MKPISIWAHQHKTAARISIIFIYILLNIIGLFTGDILHSMNVTLNSFFYLAATLIVFTGLIIYPSKRNKSKYQNFYARQKLADCLLITATFLLIIYSGNSINANKAKNYNSAYGSSIINHASNYSENIVNKNNSKVSKKNFRKYFRSAINEFRKKYTDSTKTEKTIYIILAIFAAAFLILLLGGLSCSIACSGSEALADIVFFVGLGGIIFGLIKLIQRIARGKPKNHIIKSAQ